MSGGYSLYGNHIVIESAGGWRIWYCHLDKMFVQPGYKVIRETIIGEGGSTGNSSAPHLHLTVQHIGHGLGGYVLPDVVDPLPLLGP